MQVKPLTSAPSSRARLVRNLAEGRALLDSDPEVLATYIPLHPQCKRVKAFKRAVLGAQEDLSIRFSGAVIYGPSDDDLGKLPEHLWPVRFAEHPKIRDYMMMVSPKPFDEDNKTQITAEEERQAGLTLLKADGRFVNMAACSDEYYASLLIQSTSIQHVRSGLHKDPGDICTDNVYFSGPGVGYEIDGELYALRGPCITQHRGTNHPLVTEFGDQVAVNHMAMPVLPGDEKVNLVRTVNDLDSIRVG